LFEGIVNFVHNFLLGLTASGGQNGA
jgi:hypothetical protein